MHSSKGECFLREMEWLVGKDVHPQGPFWYLGPGTVEVFAAFHAE